MSTSKRMNGICIAAIALTLVLTLLFMCGGSLGLPAVKRSYAYEASLFDTSRVHSIDIVMQDWDSFIDQCDNEEYVPCTVTVDGNTLGNVAIRAKGNTSLSSVKTMGSQRYSFKLEFDHYEAGRTLDGLDKLCLNNLIQDNTMMKDYLVYRMMEDFGADSPLCSFAYLTVNGEDWGLYLAVEGVEDSFLQRNYGSEGGALYKPDSMSFGGGRGNGKDFDMGEFDFGDFDADSFDFGNFDPDSFGGKNDAAGGVPQDGASDAEDGTAPRMSTESFSGGDGNSFGPGARSGGFVGGNMPRMGGGIDGGFGGMGSDDVKLKYIDDDPDSYSNIFDNAKTEVSAADKARLIAALKNLSGYSDLEDTLDTDEVLRYFVVHNFVCNGDSYTGSMIHNYYLYESGGRLSMIPWDYNLAFGTFQGNDASGTVNTSIDSPVSGGSADDRPMVGWIFSDETYTEAYHALCSDFLADWCDSGRLTALIEETAAMLRPYVEKDPTKFCTAEEFEAGAATLSRFVSLRAEAVTRQLSGDASPVDTDGLVLSDMGSMGGGFGGNMGGGDRGGFGGSRSNPGDDSSGVMPEGFGDKMPQSFGGGGRPQGDMMSPRQNGSARTA